MSVLGYWNIRGLAQPIRLLLNYAGEEFEDRMYETGDAPDYNLDDWLNVKYKVGVKFPNLPYYKDGKVALSQSNTILRYLARKYSLDGDNDEEKINIDWLADVAGDVKWAQINLCYQFNEPYDIGKPKYMSNLAIKLKEFEEFLGNREWFAAKKLTWVDFLIYELLEGNRLMEPTCLDNTPKLKAFLKRFEALPPIQAYMQSDRYMVRPVFNKQSLLH